MTLDELVKERLNRIQSVPAQLVTHVDRANEKIFNDILQELNQLETANGKVILSHKNLQISEQITNNLKKVVFDSDYLKAIQSFASQFDQQAALTDKYSEKVFPQFKAEDIYKTVLNQSKSQAIDLLNQDAVYQNFIAPIKNIINSSITANGTFTDVIKTLKDYTLGTNESDPTLTRYVKQVSYDSFAFADRSYSKIVSETLGVVWYKYSGGELPDSRPFCIEYHNKFFHKHEIENFGAGINIDGKDLTQELLKGRFPDTNASTIFTFAGGYNCKHVYLPVSEISVPQSVIDRNIANGNIKTGKQAAPPPEIKIEPPVKVKNQTVPVVVTAKKLAETKKELVDSVISKLPYPATKGVISADLPYEQMKEFQSQLNVLFSQYNPSNPYSKKSQPTITFRSTARSNGFVAVRLPPYNDIIEINFGHHYDKRRIDYRTIAEKRKEGETLYSPKSKVDEVNLKISTLTHEYAHVISLHYNRHDSPELTKFWNNIESLKNEYSSKIRSLKNMGPDGDDELQKIYLGDYASTNLNEFMAEGFTEYKLYSNPTPYAIKIGKLIDQYFGK